jgi:LPXTG-site transpeptidase (sortase) family protein
MVLRGESNIQRGPDSTLTNKQSGPLRSLTQCPHHTASLSVAASIFWRRFHNLFVCYSGVVKIAPIVHINRLMLVAIILINAYVILTPFFPALLFWAQKHQGTTYKRLATAVHTPSVQKSEPGNRLIAPSMLFDEQFYEGKDMRTLNQGAWHIPYSSTPDKGGNTVIIGHRFTYTNPRGTFYNLDKLKVGDEVAVQWDNKKYVYKVRDSKVVPPDATYVENPSTDPILTLYTCTPLWNPKERLVVTADLEDSEGRVTRPSNDGAPADTTPPSTTPSTMEGLTQ